MEEDLGAIEKTHYRPVQKTHMGRRLQEDLQDRKATLLR